MLYIFIAILILLTIGINYLLSKTMKKRVENKYILKKDEEDLDDFPEIMPYEQKNSFLNLDERNLYSVLKKEFEDREYRIESKVNISDIMIIKHHRKRQEFYDRIKNITIDFLICNNDREFKPLLGVKLDYTAEEASKEKKFVDAVFKNAEIPLVHLKLKKNYELEDIKEVLNKLD